ncbi:unnamed protein product [Amoebophrya sp. A120]|nr:unnamed protein product [Amoebophrya sp. A120]|eukprot:GSA120T00022470001.1
MATKMTMKIPTEQTKPRMAFFLAQIAYAWTAMSPFGTALGVSLSAAGPPTGEAALAGKNDNDQEVRVEQHQGVFERPGCSTACSSDGPKIDATCPEAMVAKKSLDANPDEHADILIFSSHKEHTAASSSTQEPPSLPTKRRRLFWPNSRKRRSCCKSLLQEEEPLPLPSQAAKRTKQRTSKSSTSAPHLLSPLPKTVVEHVYSFLPDPNPPLARIHGLVLKDRLPGRKKCGLLDFEIHPRAEDEKCRMKMKNDSTDSGAGFRAGRLSTSLQVYKMDPARGCLDERGANKDILALQEFSDCKEDPRAVRLTTVEFRCERVLQVDDKALFVRPGAANKGCQQGGDAVVTSTSGGQRQRQPIVQVKRFFAESATPLSWCAEDEPGLKKLHGCRIRAYLGPLKQDCSSRVLQDFPKHLMFVSENKIEEVVMLITTPVCQCKDRSTDKSCWDQQLCLQFYPQHQTFTFPLFRREEEDEEEEENEEYYAGARPDGDQKNLPKTDNTSPRPGGSSCSRWCAGSSSSSTAARPEPEGVYTFTGFILGRGGAQWRTSSGDRSRTTDNCTNSLHEDDGPGLDPSTTSRNCREEKAAAGSSSASSRASSCAPPTSSSCRSQEDEEQQRTPTCSIEQVSNTGRRADYPDEDRTRTGEQQLVGPILCSLDDNFAPDMQLKWQGLTKGKLPVHVKITEGPLASLFIPLGNYSFRIHVPGETGYLKLKDTTTSESRKNTSFFPRNRVVLILNLLSPKLWCPRMLERLTKLEPDVQPGEIRLAAWGPFRGIEYKDTASVMFQTIWERETDNTDPEKSTYYLDLDQWPRRVVWNDLSNDLQPGERRDTRLPIDRPMRVHIFRRSAEEAEKGKLFTNIKAFNRLVRDKLLKIRPDDDEEDRSLNLLPYFRVIHFEAERGQETFCFLLETGFSMQDILVHEWLPEVDRQRLFIEEDYVDFMLYNPVYV